MILTRQSLPDLLLFRFVLGPRVLDFFFCFQVFFLFTALCFSIKMDFFFVNFLTKQKWRKKLQTFFLEHYFFSLFVDMFVAYCKPEKKTNIKNWKGNEKKTLQKWNIYPKEGWQKKQWSTIKQCFETFVVFVVIFLVLLQLLSLLCSTDKWFYDSMERILAYIIPIIIIIIRPLKLLYFLFFFLQSVLRFFFCSLFIYIHISKIGLNCMPKCRNIYLFDGCFRHEFIICSYCISVCIDMRRILYIKMIYLNLITCVQHWLLWWLYSTFH